MSDVGEDGGGATGVAVDAAGGDAADGDEFAGKGGNPGKGGAFG